MSFLILGWVATGVYLANHVYLSTHRHYRPTLYFILNFFGASGIVVSSAAIESWQAVATNFVWAAMSLVALSNINLEDKPAIPEKWAMAPIFALGAGGIVYSPFDFHDGMAALGWAATCLFAAAYLLFTMKTIRRRRFLLYNVFAAYGITPILYLDHNWPVLFLEACWGTISALGWRAAIRSPDTPR